MEYSRGFGSLSLSIKSVCWRFTPILVLSVGVSSNCMSYGINLLFIIRSNSHSSASKCVLLVTIHLAHLLELDMADIRERRWLTGNYNRVCMDIWNNNFHLWGIPVMPMLKL